MAVFGNKKRLFEQFFLNFWQLDVFFLWLVLRLCILIEYLCITMMSNRCCMYMEEDCQSRHCPYKLDNRQVMA